MRSSLHATTSILVLTALLSTGIALAATTRGSFDRPPFYDGKVAKLERPVAYLPVTFRDEPGSLNPTPANSPALAALLDSLQGELDQLSRSMPLAGGSPPAKDAPAIRFGAARGGMSKDGKPLAPDEIDTAEPRRMNFEIEGPGKAWKEHVARVAGDSVGAVLVIQLGFSDQWVRQTSWKGSKSIEIGTNRAVPVTWLTSLDDPVQVLQLTGGLITPAGKVLRVGAEGLLARRTGMTASMAGGQEVLTEKDLAGLAPSTWRGALRDLVTGLAAPTTK